MKILTFLFVSQLLLGCASIYTGNEYKSVDLAEIDKIDSTVTFRFVSFYDVSSLDPWDNKDWFIRRASKRSYECEVVKKIKLFKKVICDVETKIENATSKHNSIEDFDKVYPIEFQTDYYVDVRVKSPFYYHGSGSGMYGLLLSAMTLGIIPVYRTHEGDYDIQIYSKDNKINLDSFKYKEDYGTLSSSLFWILPSSRYENIDFRKNYMVRNKWKYILKEVILKIRKTQQDSALGSSGGR